MKRNYFKNFFCHFYTITHHRHLVIKHAFKVGIGFRGLFHDLSKYSPVEFWNGVKYYDGSKSPTIGERLNVGASRAWMHHKGRNKHHFEYWTDFDLNKQSYEPVEMPIKYLKEMFCDRVAASKTYMKKAYNDSSALNYFLGKKGIERMHPNTSKTIEEWLRMLSEKGEKEAFRYIKKIKNTKDKHLNM